MISGALAQKFLMRIHPVFHQQIGTAYLDLIKLTPRPIRGIVYDTVINHLGPDLFYFAANTGTRDNLKFISDELTRFLDSDRATDDKID